MRKIISIWLLTAGWIPKSAKEIAIAMRPGRGSARNRLEVDVRPEGLATGVDAQDVVPTG